MTKKKNHSVSEIFSELHAERAGIAETHLLPSQHALAVQLRERISAPPQGFSERGERLISNPTTRLHSLQELLALFTRGIDTVTAKPP